MKAANERAREGGKYQIMQSRAKFSILFIIQYTFLAGVFLHVLADTLGSVGVVISSILIDRFGRNADLFISRFFDCRL